MIVDTVICADIVIAVVAGLAAGGVVAANPEARSAAQNLANGATTTVANTITNVSTNAPRGAAYIASGDWRPHQEIFPLPTQEGKSVRLGPDLGETCSGGPGGFDLGQSRVEDWLRVGSDLTPHPAPAYRPGPDISRQEGVIVLESRNYYGPFEQNGIRTSDEFWDRLDERNIDEEEAYDAYANGTKFRADNGSRLRWDPNTGVVVVIGRDGAVVTTWWQGDNPGRKWTRGW